jgi:site-specific DNA recombinase
MGKRQTIPLVDEHTFYEVQDILDSRRKKIPSKYKTLRAEFPLRGFLQCPKCGKNMTASGSKGTGGVFFYYHCTKGCKERQKANELNTDFLEVLDAFKLNSHQKNYIK